MSRRDLAVGRIEDGRLLLSPRDLVALDNVLRVLQRMSPRGWVDGERAALTGVISNRSRRDPDVPGRAWVHLRPDVPLGIVVVRVQIEGWKGPLPRVGARVQARGLALSDGRFSWQLVDARLRVLPEVGA